jgi:hypothetical protein
MIRRHEVQVVYKRDRFKAKRPAKTVIQRNDYKHERPHETAHRLLEREGTREAAAAIAWQRLQNQVGGSLRHRHWLAVLRALGRHDPR